MKKDSKIFIAGRYGLIGSACERVFRKAGYENVVGGCHRDLDLTFEDGVRRYLQVERPSNVVLAAAKVGGIYANKTYPAQFIQNNLLIQNNLVMGCLHQRSVEKLIFLGSSCVYPKDCPQPMKEEHLLIGPLEPTNKPYAVAKIAGIIMCQAFNEEYGTNFVSVMPTNMYGLNDNYHPLNSHVLPGLVHKMIQARIENAPVLTLWGTGKPMREFLYSDDCARAILKVLEIDDVPSLINIGSGQEISVKKLAELIKEIVGYKGAIEWNEDMPDGTPRKLLDSSKIRALGWEPTISLEAGIKLAVEDYFEKNHSRHI